MHLLSPLTFLYALSYFAGLASASPQYLPSLESSSIPIPFHTAVYTTTPSGHGGEWVTVAIVTLLTPREVPLWPNDGVTVVGTAISDMEAVRGVTTSRWAETKELTWILSGNSDSPRDITPTPAAQLGVAGETLTSIFTSTSYRVSTWVLDFAGMERAEWFFTTRGTFVEPVGTEYPTTIIRTGYTNVEIRYVGTNSYSTTTFEATYTSSYWRTTTMILPTGTSIAP